MLRRANNRGFTLVELLISMVLTGVLITLLFSTHMQMQTSIRNQNSLSKTTDKANMAVVFISKDIHNAIHESWNRKTFFTLRKEMHNNNRGDFLNFSTGTKQVNYTGSSAQAFNVTYYAETDEETDETILYRKEDMFTDYKNTTRGVAIPIIRKLKRFQVSVGNNEKSLRDEWSISMKKTLPLFVKVEIEWENEMDQTQKIEFQVSPGIFLQ